MKNRLIQLMLENAAAPQKLRADVSGDRPQVYLKGVISADYGVGAAELRDALSIVDGADLDLIINSPGGDAFEGREMQAVIAGYRGKINAVVAGVAASAATIVMMSAASAAIVRGSRLMIHNGWTLGMGDRHDMLALHKLLSSFDAELAGEYARYTGGAADDMAAKMDAETWYTAEQALSDKFVTGILDNSQASQMQNSVRAAWNLSAYKNAPDLSEPDELPDVAAVLATNQRRLSLLMNT